MKMDAMNSDDGSRYAAPLRRRHPASVLYYTVLRLFSLKEGGLFRCPTAVHYRVFLRHVDTADAADVAW